MNMRFAAAIVAIVLAAVAGCGTPVPEVAIEEMVSYTAHLEPLVIAHCLSCHESGEAKAKLVLDPGVGYERLVGQRSIQDPEMALVEPGDPERSYLWLKLQHVTEEGKGMPRTSTGSKKLRESELELYRRWIEGGAKP
jgi:mono/diheme cytochrome c family protein